MDNQEAAKLLSLIKLSYPTSYRDIDADTATVTVKMWQRSFADVPYPIMVQAFDHYRYTSKFPPTVAEMVDELKHIHNQAEECALIHKELGNQENVNLYKLVMSYTERYTHPNKLGGLKTNNLLELTDGRTDNECY